MDVLGKDDLVAGLIKNGKLSKEAADQALTSAIRALRQGLIEGKRVVLPEFATLQIAEQRARIVRDPKTGHQYISPATKFVSIIPDSSFQEQIDQTKLAAILLAVPLNDSFAKVIDFHFSRVGWKVLVVDSVQKCRKILEDGAAYLCIVDYAMPGAQELVRLVKAERKTSLMPIIVLFPKGRDPERADEFRVCGDEHLVEPFEVYTLLMLAESELARSSEEEVIFDQQVCLQFPTTEENLTAAGQFAADLFSSSGLDDEKQVALNAAFREAILNAAQHGNRYNKRTQIKVLYLLDKQKVTIVVTDEGQGFNHNMYMQRSESGDAVSAARERYEQGRLGGLGIMLMLRCTDHLEYNEKGNQITLTKLR
jgi:anti-sigma regulatory factor (Ser/Thr protein kinase)/nucleoid DNA-binding protein